MSCKYTQYLLAIAMATSTSTAMNIFDLFNSLNGRSTVMETHSGSYRTRTGCNSGCAACEIHVYKERYNGQFYEDNAQICIECQDGFTLLPPQRKTIRNYGTVPERNCTTVEKPVLVWYVGGVNSKVNIVALVVTFTILMLGVLAVCVIFMRRRKSAISARRSPPSAILDDTNIHVVKITGKDLDAPPKYCDPGAKVLAQTGRNENGVLPRQESLPFVARGPPPAYNPTTAV